MTAHNPVDALCKRCGRTLDHQAYEMPSPAGRLPHCLRCALRYPPLLKRSLVICLIIGTLLTAINQGNFIVAGDIQIAMAWKIPLTYAVPFGVATTGGILNARADAHARLT
ncbi:MAG: nitrate/nitrite transporter NrtS [Chloroflexi bacterium]|nr:nitrate/nitrite transporter NrtS [Chloroflexota bacterium]